MATQSYICDVLVIGGGPAGMAAAYRAAQSGRRVLIVDDNPALGGQIWRAQDKDSRPSQAQLWFDKIRQTNIELLHGARVISHPEAKVLIAETIKGVSELRFQKLILATGARERFLPFPGWTLPNVIGAAGLQALVKGGLPIKDRRVVIAGSGPLLLAVAAYLRKGGANVLLVAEQASLSHLLRFGLGLIRDPKRVSQAFKLKRELRGVPYLAGCWVLRAEGRPRKDAPTIPSSDAPPWANSFPWLSTSPLESVQLRHGRKIWSVPCDYLACGFHLIPNLELPMLLGCEVADGNVTVDDFQVTSVPNVYCAGEPTGIGGLDLSLIEGQIAGLAAVGKLNEARSLLRARDKLQRFARLLNRTFALRDELRDLPDGETIVCRCEDVTLERLRTYDSWRAAKLQTRCGMGPCQGRICGPATEFLFDWQMESVRPPIFPARVGSLAVCQNQQS